MGSGRQARLALDAGYDVGMVRAPLDANAFVVRLECLLGPCVTSGEVEQHGC